MSYQSKVTTYNMKVRMLLFFARPLNIFCVCLLAKLWKFLSYGPSTIPNFFVKAPASRIVQIMWDQEFSVYIWYFLGAAVLDFLFQEIIPIIRGE